MNNKIRIIFLNQSAGPLFRELVTNTASEIGPVILLSSDSLMPDLPHIKMISAPQYKNTNLFSRIKSWISYWIITSWPVAFCPGKPLLFIVTNPPIMPLLGWLMYRLKKQRYILLYYDIYPEVLIRFGGLSACSLVTNSWRVLNRLAIKDASLVITISEPMAKTLSPYFNIAALNEKLLVIPTWVDTEWIRPIPREENSFARLQCCSDDLVILYAGNLGAVHDLSMLPELATRLSGFPGIRFIIVGSGVGRVELENKCRDQHLANILFYPPQKEEFLPQILAAGDIGIVSLARGAEGISMPSKTYYMMAAGTALLGISCQNSELDRIIRTYDCGKNVSPGDADAAAQAIVGWYTNRGALKAAKEKARYAAQQYFDKNLIIPRILRELVRFLN